jgi:lysine 6-dehydrogenase
MKEWGIGVDIDTGAPPSIVAQMLVRGEIGIVGVHPPERAVAPEPFFEELVRRGMRIAQQTVNAVSQS